MRTRSMISLAAALALAFTGCGDGGDDVGPTATAPDTAEPTTGDAGDTGEAGSGATVTVRDIAFQEQSVRVQAGEEVTWVNEDSVGHTATSGTPDETTGVFDEDLPAGGEATVTIDDPGTYQYFCQIHPSMTAEVVVEG